MRIRHSWGAALEAVGFPVEERFKVHLNESPPFLAYQDGDIGDEEYARELGLWLELSPQDAIKVHDAILDADYPGAFELVSELQENQVFTCCFSNTNDYHWQRLCDPAFHPAVALLQGKFASHELRQAKPLPSSFMAVEAKLPEHREIVFFDDTAVNIEAALSQGWKAFKVDPALDPVEEMRAALKSLGGFRI